MMTLLRVTLKGIFRDRVFQGILAGGVLFLFIPAVGSLSMRQVTELSITLSLSLVSFILFLLAVFLGGVSLWRDIERRYTFSVLGLPISRSAYLVGKFAGIAVFLLMIVGVLGAVASLVIGYAAAIYPTGPVAWLNIWLALAFDSLKYLLLVAFAFFFSTVSTSFFLPIFGTIAVFFVGSASQDAYDFIHTPAGAKLPGLVKNAAQVLYYILPNFSAFDLKINAIYGIKASGQGLLLTFGYFIIYTAIVLFLATIIFSRRELK